MSPSLQQGLLRVLQERTFRRVGSELIRANFRQVTATKQSLRTLMEQNRFREDLYYRLMAGKPVELPSLRERPWDMVRLAVHFLKGQHSQNHRLTFEPTALERLVKAPWSVNVRQLMLLIQENAVPRAPASRLEQIPVSLVMAVLAEQSARGHSGWAIPSAII